MPPSIREDEQRQPRAAHKPSAVTLLDRLASGTVFLETARADAENRVSLLFEDPVEVLTASVPEQVSEVFHEVDLRLKSGLYVAGFVGYEAAYGFEDLGDCPETGQPLVWFGVYRHPETLSVAPLRASSDGLIEDPVEDASFSWDKRDYVSAVRRLRYLIGEGDVYQVNLTGVLELESRLSPALLYQALKARQRVGYGAYLRTENMTVLSFSPELFFRRDGDRIWTRPMKGTGARGRNLAEDARLAADLKGDEKTRAENLMIVDLLRNDLSRITLPGSVVVPDLFTVEDYETLKQVTSTVTATLSEGSGYSEIFRALFPCGSVTGAPKVRAMQVIKEIERAPRGVYTGAIGFIAPDDRAVFSVAIRTVVAQDGKLRMGTGGGIVWDSVPETEFAECLAKARFLTERRSSFCLIETIRFDGFYRLLNYHLDRLNTSSTYFGFPFDGDSIRRALVRNLKKLTPGEVYKVRLQLDGDGVVEIENHAGGPLNAAGMVVLSSKQIDSSDRFKYHKTTHRELYEAEYALASEQGFTDVLFVNEHGHVTEGSRTNVYVKRDGYLVTPPVNDGLLPGVVRRFLLNTRPDLIEDHIPVDELRSAEAVYVSNAILGLVPVRFVSVERPV